MKKGSFIKFHEYTLVFYKNTKVLTQIDDILNSIIVA